MAKVKQKSNGLLEDTLETGHERLRSAGKATVKSLANEADKSSKTFLEQLLGMDFNGGHKGHAEPTSHTEAPHAEAPSSDKEYTPGGAEIHTLFVNTSHERALAKKAANEQHKTKESIAEGAIDYRREVIKGRERLNHQEKGQKSQTVEQIKHELAQFVKASDMLKMQFAEVGVDSSQTEVGDYHETFFDQFLNFLRTMRAKVEDAGAWLSVSKGKGAKGGYNNMAKKHGGMFTQSGERSAQGNTAG